MPFPGCDGSWKPVGDAQVLYLSPRQMSVRQIRRILLETTHDVIYLNSCFSRYFTMVPLCIERTLPRHLRKPVVLAPRGEFSKGAMSIRGGRKAAWLRTARALSLFENVIWQASSAHEEEDIRRVAGPLATIRIAPDLTVFHAAGSAPRKKSPGSLKIAHLGRISAIKNLAGALDMLRHVRGDVDFHVMGPSSNESYVAECRAQAATLPANIRVHFEGTVSPGEVPARLERCHVLLALTLGENFGHVILEALTAGCLPIVSDRTPWRGLAEAGIGWDLPLERLDQFRAAVQECVDLDQAGFDARSAKARHYAEVVHRDLTPRRQNLALFHEAFEAERKRAGDAEIAAATPLTTASMPEKRLR